MADYLQRQVEFVSKLVRLSQERKIDWRLHEKGGFVGQVLGREVRIFSADRSTQSTRGLPSAPTPVLEILASNGSVAMSIVGLSGLRDLLASAANRAVQIDEFMDQVLAS